MMELNASLDFEVECSVYDHARAPDCVRKIPVGQRHHRDRFDPIRRICACCVRHMSWSHHYENRRILTRVEITYSDGGKRYLDGEAADEWDRAVAGAAVMSAVHGAPPTPLPWVEVPPPASSPSTPSPTTSSTESHTETPEAGQVGFGVIKTNGGN